MENIVLNLLIILTCVIASISVARLFGFGTILGFLIAGMVVGPFGLKLISDAHIIELIGEFGIIFLMFLIGVEMQPSKLWSYRKWVFGLGGLQVATLSITFGSIAYLIGFTIPASILIGLAFSLSSTAIDLQILNESKDMDKAYGQKAFSILLFQDIMAIPILALIPILSLTSSNSSPITVESSLIPIAIVFAIIFAGKYIIGKTLHLVAKSKSQEAFTGICLALVFSLAWLTGYIGLPMAMGGFIAGILMSESNFRHQIQSNIEPFKLMLLGFFFISIGMSIDFGTVSQNLALLIELLIGVIVIKMSMVYLVCRCFNIKNKSSFSIAVILSQIGEFALVVLSLACHPNSQIIQPDDAHLLILVISLSMFFTPVLFKIMNRVSLKIFTKSDEEIEESIIADVPVIILGYGRVGMTVGQMMESLNIKYIAIDGDADVVANAKKQHKPVFFGDTSNHEVLKSVGAEKAEMAIVALDGTINTKHTIQIVKHYFPHLKIFARAKSHIDSHILKHNGATFAIPETTESSLQIGTLILRELGYSRQEVQNVLSDLRNNHYEKLLHTHGITRADIEREIINSSNSSHSMTEKSLIKNILKDKK